MKFNLIEKQTAEVMPVLVSFNGEHYELKVKDLPKGTYMLVMTDSKETSRFEGFDEFWENYGYKYRKAKAMIEWKKLPRRLIPQILSHSKIYGETEEFKLAPYKYLNERIFLEKLKEEKKDVFVMPTAKGIKN